MDGRPVARRTFLRYSVLLAGGVSLLAACSPAAAPAPTAGPAKPTEAPKPAAPAATTAAAPAAAPAATQAAPAAAKPADAAKPVAATGKPVIPLAASGGFKETTIRILFQTGPEGDAHTRLSPKFTEYTQGKVKVEIEEGGRGDAYDAKFISALQAKSSAWDVLHDTGPRFLGSGPAGFFAPLGKFMADKELFDAEAYNNDDFPKALRDVFSYNGEQMLMVQEASGMLFNYRKDLLQKYGVPEPPLDGYDWDTLMGHLKTIQDGLQKDGKSDVYPLLLGAKRAAHAYRHLYHYTWAKGGQMFDGITPMFDSPEMVEAATFLPSLIYDKKYVTEGAVGYEYPEVLTGFQQGKAVTAFQWNAASPTFLDATKSPETAGKVGFSMLPYFKDKGGKMNRFDPSPHAVGVSAFSKNQREAFAYVAWFTSQEVARDYVVNGGGSSGRGSLLTDKEILAKNPQYAALNEVLKLQHPYPQMEQYGYVANTILASHAGAVWSRQETAADGMKAAKTEAIQYLKEQGVKL